MHLRTLHVAVLVVTTATSCRDVTTSYRDLACPCVAGYVCDPTTQLCVRPGADTRGGTRGDDARGDAAAGDALTGDTFAGDAFTGDAFAGDAFAGDAFAGDDAPTGDASTGDDNGASDCPGGRDTIAFDAAATANDPGSTYSWQHTTSGSNRLLLVGIAHRGDGITVDSVTYDGVALHAVGVVPDDPTIDLFALPDPAPGTNTVEVTLSGSQDSSAGSLSLTGVNLGKWRDGALGTGSGNGSDVSAAVTTSTPGAWVVDVVAADGNYGTPAQPQIERWREDRGEPHGFSSTRGPIDTPASIPMEWTLDNSEKWRIIAVPIRPACLP